VLKDQLILIIDNKGEKDNFAVSEIRIDKLNGADEVIVKKCINDCLNENQNYQFFILSYFLG
jgi:hypothetical protein